MCISHLFSEATQWSLDFLEPVDSAADENWRSSQTLFQCSSLVLMAKPVALSMGCWTGLRAKSFSSCSFLMHLVQIANHQYHLLLLRVLWHILQLSHMRIRRFVLSFSPFFQLENQFFIHAGSELDDVRIPLWSAFKQVWQQAALFAMIVFFYSYSRRSLKFFSWYDYLIRLQGLDLEGWVVSLAFPYLFLTLQARTQQQTEILIHLLKKLAPVNDISGVLYLVDPVIFHKYGKNFSSRVAAHAPTKYQSNSTSGRGARASYRTMLPEISARRSLLEPSFRYLSPGREGEKRRPLDHMWQNPFVHSARKTIGSNSYIYNSILVISPMWYIKVCLTVMHI